MIIFRIVVGVFIFGVAACCFSQEKPYGNLILLDGYRFERSHTFDTINGVISRPGGLRIEFESGLNEGYAADPKEKAKFVWFREQTIGGTRVYIALAQPNRIPWQPNQPRDKKLARILVVTFPRTLPQDAANFYAEVLNEEEIADALLMILTFDPAK